MLLEELYTHMDINIKLAMAALFYLTLQVFLPFFKIKKKREIFQSGHSQSPQRKHI